LLLGNGDLLRSLGFLVGDRSWSFLLKIFFLSLISSLDLLGVSKDLIFLIFSELLSICSLLLLGFFLSSLVGFFLSYLIRFLLCFGSIGLVDKIVLFRLLLLLLIFLGEFLIDVSILFSKSVIDLLTTNDTVLFISFSVCFLCSIGFSLELSLLRRRFGWFLFFTRLSLILGFIFGDITLGLGGISSSVSGVFLSFISFSLTGLFFCLSFLLDIILSMLLGFFRVFLGVLVGLLVMLLPVDSKLKELSISNWGSIELDGLADLGVGKGAD
jgi:hypothetical protein